MKTKVYISFRPGRDRSWEEISKIFQRARCKNLCQDGPSIIGLYGDYFFEGERSLDLLRRELQKEEIEWSETVQNMYTEKELRTFPMLVPSLNRAPVGDPGPITNREFDLSTSCPNCGTGASQISAVRLRPSDLPKKNSICQTIRFETLISDELVAAVKKARISGLRYREVISSTTEKPLPWKQIEPTTELPPMNPSTKGISRDEVCTVCERNGHFCRSDEPFEVYYKSNGLDLDRRPDIVGTWERFGYAIKRDPLEHSVFPDPLFVINQRVFHFLREQKVRGLVFTPVRFIDD